MSYFDRTELLSASQIKAFLKKGMANKSESRSLVIGSIVDLVLTEDVELEATCQIDRGVNIPSGQMKTFTEKLYNFYQEDWLNGIEEISEENYQKAYDEVGIKQRKVDKMIEDFNKDRSYFNHLLQRDILASQGKYLISEDEEKQVLKSIKEIRASNFNKYFEDGFTQLEIYTDYFKIKLDSLYIDWENKTIQLVDLKTMADYTENFASNIVRFRYDIQANFYYKVISDILSGTIFTAGGPKADVFNRLWPEIRDFKLLDTFNFVFVSKKQSEVLEVRYKIEEEKEVLSTMLNTEYDINRAVLMHRECRDKNVEPNLTNYCMLNGSSITI